MDVTTPAAARRQPPVGSNAAQDDDVGARPRAPRPAVADDGPLPAAPTVAAQAEAARSQAEAARATRGAFEPAPPPPGAAAELDDGHSPSDHALARLARSRELLRHALMPPSAARRALDEADAALSRARSRGWSRRSRRWWGLARRRLDESPLALLAMDSVQTWWQRHPWRAAAAAVADEVGDAVRPAIRRHPALSVALAAGAGAAVVAAQPWHWRWFADQMRRLPRRALRWTLLQLSQAPVQTVLAGLVLAKTGQAVAEKTAEAAAKPDSAGPAATDLGDGRGTAPHGTATAHR